ncbi:MAG: hypothetical protein K6F37_09140 [Lachnospiraceae bacterium]|nr:hypothetical protein [Lachnospiraceae bacterium]
MKVAFVSGKHASMANGTKRALENSNVSSHADFKWMRNGEEKNADMILFYTEKPETDIWEFENEKPYGNVPRFYLMGNLDENSSDFGKRYLVENRLSKVQTEEMDIGKVMRNAFYSGNCKKFFDAAREGNVYANRWFVDEVGRIILSIQKYGEVYYGRDF